MRDRMIVGEEEIVIKTLCSVLMKNNLGNYKQSRTLIKHLQVTVNGIVEQNPEYKVQLNDVICVHGNIIDSQPFVYYMMNKPKGMVSAHHDKEYSCVTELLDRDDCYCVGRLDKETTGFLLLTNDQSLSKQLLLPQRHVEKRYYVTLGYPFDERTIVAFQEGVLIDDHIPCLPASLEKIDDFHCFVTLYEGKYHQIKKMFLSCDNQVVDLKRISFAGIDLDSSLKEGQYRSLNQEEFQKLKEFISLNR